MQWTTPPKPPSKPWSDKRQKRKFAFWPTELDNGTTIWFEFYIQIETFKKSLLFGAYDWYPTERLPDDE